MLTMEMFKTTIPCLYPCRWQLCTIAVHGNPCRDRLEYTYTHAHAYMVLPVTCPNNAFRNSLPSAIVFIMHQSPQRTTRLPPRVPQKSQRTIMVIRYYRNLKSGLRPSMHAHMHTTHLLNSTIGETYNDDHHSIHNKHFWRGHSIWEAKKRLRLMEESQARRWVSLLSGESTWAMDGKVLQQVTLCYICLQKAVGCTYAWLGT